LSDFIGIPAAVLGRTEGILHQGFYVDDVTTKTRRRELRNRGIAHEVQVPVDIIYAGERIDAGLRIDLLVERSIILELKAVDRLMPIHQAQLLTYLKLTDLRLGLLINFNVALFKEGVKRMIR
jgi:GxxExxY protein